MMNKEEILQASRRENKNQDLADMEVKTQGGYAASVTGMAAVVLVTLLAQMISNIYLYAPFFIYFSMMSTQWCVRYRRYRRKSDLVIMILFAVLSLLALYVLVKRLYEAAG